jgi:hypothetical protein
MIFDRIFRKMRPGFGRSETEASEKEFFSPDFLYDAILDAESSGKDFSDKKISQIFSRSVMKTFGDDITSEVNRRKLLRSTLVSAYSYQGSSRFNSFKDEMDEAWNLLEKRIEDDLQIHSVTKERGLLKKQAERRIFEFLQGAFFSRKGVAAAASFAVVAFMILQQDIKSGVEPAEFVTAPESVRTISEETVTLRPYHLAGSDLRIDVTRGQKRSFESPPSFSFVSSGNSFPSGAEGNFYTNSHNSSQLISNEGLHAFREYSDFNTLPSHDILDSVEAEGGMPQSGQRVIAGVSQGEGASFTDAPVSSEYLRFTANE